MFSTVKEYITKKAIMDLRVEGISSCSYVSPVYRVTRVQPVKLTKEEAEEIRVYLAKFPNPKHLSFEELLQENIKELNM